MERIDLNKDVNLSRLVYGMWRLGDDTDQTTAHVQAKIEACLEQGITSFDQADIYGDYESETLFGTALRAAPELRDRMEIITKCDILLKSSKYPDRRVKHYDSSAAHITASAEASLRKMNVDVIDLFLIHRPDPLMDHHETGRALDDLVASGKVRAVGVSNFKLHDWTLLQSAMVTPLCTNQIELSLVSQEAFRNGDIAFMQERGIPPMAWSPLAGGALCSPKYPDLCGALARIGAEHGVADTAVAVAWLLAHPARIIPVLGTNNPDRIRRIGDALKVKLDREVWFELYELASGTEVP